jgi:uroporphyrin-III C-methyltransferase/precorrin-2 dehydrogenase/sirohydrochlorin ferrochelatase
MSGERMESQTGPERLGALARLPLFFALEDKRVVIAGGSQAAAWKAELLSATGARVDVYAGYPCRELLQLAADRSLGHTLGHALGPITLHRRAWTAADLPDAALAVGDCRGDEEAARFASAACNAGVPVNVIDKPSYCNFSFGAIVNRSPLVIGISTDGAAPVFARAIRGRLEALLSKGFARWAVAAAAWRAGVRTSGLSRAGRRRFWELFVEHAMAHAGVEPRQDDFERFIDAANAPGCGIDHGAVTVVEIDNDDPDSLTLRAIRALHAADVIVFDAQIPRWILDFARREAKKIRVNDTPHGGEVDALMAEFEKQGARLVRLKPCHVSKAAQVFNQSSHPAAPPLVPDGDFTAAH